ncbi:bacterial proteasome activator family protein [Nocardia sp. 004]|uniref:bacterial proteasome activator family protein n=1 Tax=Nocardia sp. 004 TaxID=3385978 RepID=UPI00399FC301
MTHSDEAPDHIVVVGPDGKPLTIPATAGSATSRTTRVVADDAVADDNEKSESDEKDDSGESLADMVEHPAKVMRIGTMIKQLLEEVRAAPLDEASRNRLKQIHKSSVRELEQGLAPELREELERLTLPFTDDTVPSDAELRIAQAQLVGWLEGLFHGIQTALFAQQMAARAQLEQMRQGALPPAVNGAEPRGNYPSQLTGGSGQYL